MKKKLIFVWDSIEIGGVDTYLFNLLTNKFFHKFEIIVLTNKNNMAYDYLKFKLKSFKNIHFLKYFSFFSVSFENIILRSFYFFLKPVLFLVSIIFFLNFFKNKNFYALIAQCGNYGNLRSEPAAIIAAYILGIKKKIIVVHHKCEKSRIFMKSFNGIINNIVLKCVDKFIVVSRATKESMKKNCNFFLKTKFNPKVIYNGLPIRNLKKKNYLKQIIKKDKNKINVCILARINPSKGQEDLINTLIKYKKNIFIDKMNFYLIGKGDESYTSYLKNICRENKISNIFFTGFLKEESYKILTSFDLSLSLTRDFEGFGLSIAESMLAGTPIIATKVGAVTEFLNSQNSTLIKSGNKNELSQSLENFVKNKSDFIKKSFNARNKIKKDFNSNIMCKKYLLEIDNQHGII